jgi:hypothetical protein
MLATEAARREAAEQVLSNLRLEGLEPNELGKSLMEQVIKGTLTTTEAIKILDQHNHFARREASVKVA